ncbi:MAG: hypothetical protein ACE5FK_03885 [Candidatus Methylomirabilia bacterium]
MSDRSSAVLVAVLSLAACASTGRIPREPFYDMRVPESFVLSLARHARR